MRDRRNINVVQRSNPPEYDPFDTAYLITGAGTTGETPPAPPPAPPPPPSGAGVMYEPFNVPVNLAINIILDAAGNPWRNPTTVSVVVKEANHDESAYWDVFSKTPIKPNASIPVRLWKERKHEIRSSTTFSGGGQRLTAEVYLPVPNSVPLRYSWRTKSFELDGDVSQYVESASLNYTSVYQVDYTYVMIP